MIFLSNMDNKEFLGEDRRSAGIAFMNANNAASNMIAALIDRMSPEQLSSENITATLRLIRADILVDYAKYHNEVVSRTGASATDEEIKRAVGFINGSIDLVDLRRNFLSLREPVQKHPNVKSAAKVKKEEFEEPTINFD